MPLTEDDIIAARERAASTKPPWHNDRGRIAREALAKAEAKAKARAKARKVRITVGVVLAVIVALASAAALVRW